MAHCSTPSCNDNKSPYEKLCNQPMQTLLPDLRNIKRKSTQHTDLPAKLNPKFVERQKFYHDRSAKQLAEIPTSSTVGIHNGKNWPTKAEVIEKARSPMQDPMSSKLKLAKLFIEVAKGGQVCTL